MFLTKLNKNSTLNKLNPNENFYFVLFIWSSIYLEYLYETDLDTYYFKFFYLVYLY